jgi:hypothetical protein
LRSLFRLGTGDDSELDNYFVNHPYVSDPRDGGSGVVSITPDSAVVNTVGGRAVFAFNGGTAPYTWDVADSSKGTISGSGAQGVYTATVVGNNDVIAYDREGHAAIAKITGSSSALAISASPSSLATNGSMAIIKATGGVAPYEWKVTDLSKGGFGKSPSVVETTTGSSVVYSRTAASDNVVTVKDFTGATDAVRISQPY